MAYLGPIEDTNSVFLRQTNLHQPPRFPQELFDAIMDEFHSDKKSLATCTAVCKAWLPSARRHLFAFVGLHASKLGDFTKFIESHPSLIRLIRHLYVRGVWNLLQKSTWKPGQALDHFIGLKLLEITQISLEIPVVSSNYSTIVRLSLHSVYFVFFKRAVRFICAFPSLQTLRMKTIYYNRDYVHVSLPLPPCNLQDLDLDQSVAEDIAEWLLSFKKTPAIRAFWHKTCLGTEAISRRFLRAISGTLERISFEHYEGNTPFDLSCNSQLRFIHFAINKIRWEDWQAEWVTETLSQIDSNQLEEVSLTLIWRKPDGRKPELLDWSRLDTILSQPRFPKLRRVEICYHGWLTSVDIKERLLGCHARGILHFTSPKRDYRGFHDT